MKILHVQPYYAPAWAYGGTPRAVFEIAKKQSEKGHDVSVLTTDAFLEKKRFKGVELLNNVKVFRLKNISNFLCWKYHFPIPINFPKQILDKKYDVVHLHEVRTTLNYLALKKINSNKFVISPWGTLPYNNSQIYIKKIIDFFIMPLFQKKIDIAFGQTVNEMQVIESFNLSKNRAIIPLGIDSDFFSMLPSKKVSREFLKIDKNKKVYLFLGRFSPYKGLSLLIETFTILSKKNNNFELLLVGRDDGYEDCIRHAIKENKLEKNVRIVKPLYEKERLFAYCASDFFISLPTVYEETSTTCLEALLCGTPVITNHYSEVPILNNIDGVFHIDNKNPLLLSEDIKKISNLKLTVNINKVKEVFDWTKISEQFIYYYGKKK